MTNLVERLRAFGGPGISPHKACLEAADKIECLEAEVKRLKQALLRYGTHDFGCNAAMVQEGAECTCGFGEAYMKLSDE